MRHIAGLVGLTVLLASLTACANGSGKSLEQSLAADPRLKDTTVSLGSTTNDRNSTNNTTVKLPDDFPTEIPLYPNAQLKEVTQTTGTSATPGVQASSGATQVTRWTTSDPINLVESFYQKQFHANNWQILRQPTDEQGGTFEVRRHDLQASILIQPQSAVNSVTSASPSPSQPIISQNSQAITEFVIQYTRNAAEAAQGNTNSDKAVPKPGDPDFIGPVPPKDDVTLNPVPSSSTELLTDSSPSPTFTDLNNTPPQLRQYVKDLLALNVLPLQSNGSKTNQATKDTQFNPNKPISHREYARWLVAANNSLYSSNPAKQIREASTSSQPAFQDVPLKDPDFPIIQGLAEAGLISSPLSGDATTVLFRPDAPLTREQMILWKVPLDTHQALPNATIESIKQTWGFQDAAKIDPKALRAVLADFQSGEQSNIRRLFGYTTLFQPQKSVTRAEAAAALWYFGTVSDGISAKDALKLKQQQSQSSTTPQSTSSSSPTGTP